MWCYFSPFVIIKRIAWFGRTKLCSGIYTCLVPFFLCQEPKKLKEIDLLLASNFSQFFANDEKVYTFLIIPADNWTGLFWFAKDLGQPISHPENNCHHYFLHSLLFLFFDLFSWICIRSIVVEAHLIKLIIHPRNISYLSWINPNLIDAYVRVNKKVLQWYHLCQS